MSAAAAVLAAVSAGVDALINLGHLAEENRAEANRVLVEHMLPTPSDKEVVDFEDARKLLGLEEDTSPSARAADDTEPPPSPPMTIEPPPNTRPKR